MLVLLVLVWTKSLPKSRLYPAVTALLLGLAICTPVLVPQTMEAKRFYSNRQLGKDLGIQRAFASMMLPFPLAKLEVTEKEPSYNQYIPLMWGGPVNKRYRGGLYYSGTFFSASRYWCVCSPLALPGIDATSRRISGISVRSWRLFLRWDKQGGYGRHNGYCPCLRNSAVHLKCWGISICLRLLEGPSSLSDGCVYNVAIGSSQE